MDTDTIAPAFEAGLAALREAGLMGMSPDKAEDLADTILDDAWRASGLSGITDADLGKETLQWWGVDAPGALMASYQDGIREFEAQDSAPYRATIIFEELPANATRADFIGALLGALPALSPAFAERTVDRVVRARTRKVVGPYYSPHPTKLVVCEPDPAMDREYDRQRRMALAMYAEARASRPKHDPLPVKSPEPEPAETVPTFDLENEPGLLGDIARWSQTYAFRPVREFALPAAISVGGAIFGRRWATPTGLGLNLYQVAIGETGGGKDALLGAPKALLAKAGFRRLIGPGDFSSDAALETSLRMHPSQLMPLDEFGKLAQAMMGRNAPSFAKLAAKALLEIYPRSAPGSEWSGKQRADAMRDNASEPVHAPTLSILAVSTPEGFFEGMSQQTLEDGFLNRITVIRAGAAGPRQRDHARLEPPADLVKRLQDAYSASGPAGDLVEAKTRSASVAPTFRFARWADDDALRAIEEVEAWEDAATDAGRRGVCGRAAEQTQKIATIRALFRDPADPAVTAEDVRWAFAMVRASIEAIEEGARSMMAGSEFETLCNAIEAAAGKAGPMGLPYSYLLRAKGVSKHDDRMVESALKRLSQIGRIYVDLGPTSKTGKPSKRVRLMNFGAGIEEH